MFCGECGTQNPDTNQFCKNCGKPLRKPHQVPAPQPVAVPAQPQATPAPVVPVSQPVPATSTGVPPPAEKPPRNWPGIGSIILGILAWLVIPYILGIIAVILGVISVYKSKKGKNTRAIAGILGIVIAVTAMLVNYFYIFIF
jgi:hypothetical protein